MSKLILTRGGASSTGKKLIKPIGIASTSTSKRVILTISTGANGPSGTDSRSVPDPAQGYPTNITYESPITLLSGMAGGDGIIRITNRNFAGTTSANAILLNCGSTPVIISNCIIKHSPTKSGIYAGGNSNITVIDVSIYGDTPTMDGNSRSPSIYLFKPTYVDMSHVSYESAGGIKIDGWGGSLTGRCWTQNLKSRNVIGKNGDFRHCIQWSNVHTSNLLVKYVESYNEPNKSRTEDTINIYNSGGTGVDTPMIGQGFYLHGSYPYPATSATFTGAAFSADGSGNASETPSQYIQLSDAWMVSNCGAAANIATGNDIHYHNMYGVTSGYFPDSTVMSSSYRGFWIGDYYNLGAGANNTMDGITTRFMRTKDLGGGTRRADFIADPNVSSDVPNPGIDVSNAVLLPDPTSIANGLEQERQAFIGWRNYLNANNQTCGSRYIPS